MGFGHLGYAFLVDEKDIEKTTAFASCGIGFVAYILNCFYETGLELGFPNDISLKIVSNIFNNALAKSDYQNLVSAVAAKGGATEIGIDCFNKNNLKTIISDGVNNAYNKMK